MNLVYAIGYKNKENKDCFISGNFDIHEELDGKLFYKKIKTAEKALKKANEIFPIRLKNLKKHIDSEKEAKIRFTEQYEKELQVLNNIKIYEIELNIKNIL